MATGDADSTDSAAPDWRSAYEGEVIDTPVDAALIELARERAPGAALDLGCGTGQNSVWLAQRGWQVTGIDIVPRAIEMARERARIAGVEIDFEVADVITFMPERSYDLVMSTYALPPSGRGRVMALRMAADAVGPGGTLLICEFDIALAEDGWMAADDLVSLDEITAALGGMHVESAEVRVARHSHGEAERQLPIAIVTATRRADGPYPVPAEP